MLTVRFGELQLRPGALVLDAGAGFGRHAFEVARRGAGVVALDRSAAEVAATSAVLAAMAGNGEIPRASLVTTMRGDATALPFADAVFDHVLTSEVLEHVQDDVTAIAELTRVLKPGGSLTATVPAWLPEKINWMLTDEYHAPQSQGGHVRIYSATELKAKLRAAGLQITATHRAHALHSPYWWLRCAVGLSREEHRAVAAYRRLLEWEIVRRPRSLRAVEWAFAPVIGKSYVVYARKPAARCVPACPATPAPASGATPAEEHSRAGVS